MRHLATVVAFALAFAAGASLAQVTLNPSTRYELSNCASGGSAGTSVAAGKYVMRVTDADTRICIAQTANADAGTVCGTLDGGAAGELFPTGTVMGLTIPGTGRVVSCLSSTGTGDLHLTPWY